MKAILVIDLNADELPKDAYANVYVFGKYYDEQEDDFLAYLKECPLKPMPEKKEVVFSKVMDYQDGYYAEGWNACLEEIEE